MPHGYKSCFRLIFKRILRAWLQAPAAKHDGTALCYDLVLPATDFRGLFGVVPG
jgi:hypothetical protein